jgi:aryl-alcohol dehydrogenase-like predicted oxidoreductase
LPQILTDATEAEAPVAARTSGPGRWRAGGKLATLVSMKLHKFGTTDLNVSDLCLGTMQFGWTADEPTSFTVMDAFVEVGGNFIDTADVYSNWVSGNPGGVAEEIVGRWMKERGNRERIVVATKVRGRMWEGPDGEGLGRVHIMRAVEDSLRRLQIETIDLYQCHFPDDDTPIEETLSAFQDLTEAGKVRYIGASNYDAPRLGGALKAADEKGLPRFVALQPHYNLAHRPEFESALADLCQRETVAVIPYSPLARGFLTGKYRRGQPLPQSERLAGVKPLLTEQGFRVIDALDEVATTHGTTPAAVALAWLLAKPTVASPITGANTPEQLAGLLPATELRLSADEIEALNTASADM